MGIPTLLSDAASNPPPEAIFALTSAVRLVADSRTDQLLVRVVGRLPTSELRTLARRLSDEYLDESSEYEWSDPRAEFDRIMESLSGLSPEAARLVQDLALPLYSERVEVALDVWRSFARQPSSPASDFLDPVLVIGLDGQGDAWDMAAAHRLDGDVSEAAYRFAVAHEALESITRATRSMGREGLEGMIREAERRGRVRPGMLLELIGA